MNEQIVMTQDGETSVWVTDVNDWFSSLSNLKLECQNYTVSEMRFQEILKEHDAKIRAQAIDEFAREVNSNWLFRGESGVPYRDTIYGIAKRMKEEK